MLSARRDEKVDRLRRVAREMLLLAFAATVLAQPSAVLAQEVQPPQPSQDQTAISTSVRVANFSSLPQKFQFDVVEFLVPENELQGVVSVEAVPVAGPLYGAHPLGKLQVEQLDLAVSTELVRFKILACNSSALFCAQIRVVTRLPCIW